MTKRTKRIVAAFLATITALTAFPMSALAASSIGSDSGNISVGEDTVQNAKTTYEQVTEGNAKTRVYLTVNDSDLVVSVPTTIIVSGTPDKNGDYIGEYSVKVSGDMAGSKTVTVKPENELIALKQAGKSDVSAKINQNKTLFDSADFKKSTITNGKVTANKLTAGSWKATTNFIISTEDLSKPVYQASNGYSSGYIEKTSIVPSNTFSHTEKFQLSRGSCTHFLILLALNV